MKLISMHILRKVDNKAIFLSSEFELSFLNFLKRNFAKEPIRFAARTASTRTKNGETLQVTGEEFEGMIVYIRVTTQGTAFVIIADKEYPKSAAFKVTAEIEKRFFLFKSEEQLSNFNSDTDVGFSELPELLKKYQDPDQADKLRKIESQLTEIETNLSKTMSELLERGENLDDLMKASEDIGNTAFQFYQNAKKTNQRCCSLY